jgi:transposase
MRALHGDAVMQAEHAGPGRNAQALRHAPTRRMMSSQRRQRRRYRGTVTGADARVAQGGQQLWLRVQHLPSYAHDLIPIELVWGNLKDTELANLCPDILDDADTAAHTGLHRIGSSYQLCFNFLDHTGLRL